MNVSDFDRQLQPPYRFSLSFAETAVTENKKFLMCRGTTPVALSELAPDISLAEVSDCTVEFKELKLAEVIGVGGYATVYRGTFRNRDVAVKKLQLSLLPGSDRAKDAMLAVFAEFRREVQLMTTMRHEKIVALEAVVTEPFCLALEFMDLGNLYEIIHDDTRILDWPTRYSLAVDIAEGMAFIHDLDMIHRDLKSPNVLVKRDPSSRVGIVAKIADFGLTRKLMLAPTLVDKVVDNPVWLAPEILSGKHYNQRVDVYSYGVILYELITREDYFGEITFMSMLENKVVDGDRPTLTQDDCPLPALINLVRECWDSDPKKRPSFLKILENLHAVVKPELPGADPKALQSFEHDPKPIEMPSYEADVDDDRKDVSLNSDETTDSSSLSSSSTSTSRTSLTERDQSSSEPHSEMSRDQIVLNNATSAARKKRKKKGSKSQAKQKMVKASRPSWRTIQRYPLAKALFDFESQHSDEISFEKGEIIQILEMDGDFCKGRTKDGRIGWFQADYTSRISFAADEEESISQRKRSSMMLSQSKSDETAKAMALIQEQAKAKQKQVEKQVEKPVAASSSQAAIPAQKVVVAIASYSAERSDILSFEKGQEIVVLQKSSAEWSVGSIDGTIGLFPMPYTKELNI